MKPRVDLQEFLGAYLAEVDEHLASASEKTLAIETSLRQGSQNPRAVRDLFRTLHTVKGLSAMVGVEPIVVIAHRLESILRAADRGTAAITAASVEALFEALKAIEQRVRALEHGAPVAEPPAALLERLDAVEGTAATALAPVVPAELDLEPAIASKLLPFEREQLLQGSREGRRVLRADFVPSPRRAAEGLTINSVRARVGSLAEIVKVVPVAVAATEAAPGGLSFLFLLVTTAEDLEIASAVGCEPIAVRSLFQAVSPASATVASGPTPAVEDEPPFDDLDPPELQTRSVLRVDVGRVDEAMDRLSALIVTRSRLARAVAALEGSSASRELGLIVQENARQLRDLRAALLRIRMVPFAEVLSRLPLILRGIKRASGKEVTLRTDAAGAELDKAVAERIFPALVHLVRNAIDHGMGTPHDRVLAGKQPEGQIVITCSARTNRLLTIEVSDDGKGIDRQALARSSGGEVPEGDAALLEVLCRPGLSTRTEATTTSGRGMGMDIVRKIVVEQLGGELSLHSESGQGTTFTLRVPLTVSIMEALIARCGGERYAVAVSTVDEILELDPARMVHGPGRQGERGTVLIERRGETLPLLDLARVLGARDESPPRQALVVRRGGETVAFGLERVLAQQETVVRPLVDPLVQVPGISGSTDLGDGQPTLVLDLVAMLAHLGSHRRTVRGHAA